MKAGDIVQLKSAAAQDTLSVDGEKTRPYTDLMTVEDVRKHAVTCVFFRDQIIQREDIAEHCLVSVDITVF